MSKESNQDGNGTTCPPDGNVIFLPPGEVSFVAVGLGLAVAFGFALGILFSGRARGQGGS